MRDPSQAREAALALLAANPAHGPELFELASQALATGLDYRIGGVGLLQPDGHTVKLVAIWDRQGEVGPFSYDLAGSPCEYIYRDPQAEPHLFVPGSVMECFGAAHTLAGGPVGYRGEVFRDASGAPAGHVFAISDSPEEDDPDDRGFFRLVSQRVGAEYNRWRAEEALRQSENRTRAAEQRLLDAIESIPEGFVLYDSDDRLVLYNRAWTEIYGYGEGCIQAGVSYADQLELDAAQLAANRDPQAYIEQRLRDREQEAVAREIELANGRWIAIRERRTADGGVVGIQTDITEAKKAERVLVEARDIAERADQAKSDFLAKMSHELRTPLNAIIGFSDLIGSAAFGPLGSPRYVEYCRDINGAAHHLLELVNNLLDVAKIGAGEEVLNETDVDVAEVLNAALALVREPARNAGLAIDVDLDPDIHTIWADRRRLTQILVNLLSNAVKFTDRGGQVRVSVHSDNTGNCVFEIADTGMGISREDLDTALANFGQIRPTDGRLREGTGLGLPLARALAELHGGALNIASEPGKGTTVTIRLPVDRRVGYARPSRKARKRA